MIKRLHAPAVLYKSYLLQGVAPYINEHDGLSVASVFRPVTAELKGQLKQDKEALLDFLRAGRYTGQLLQTYSLRDRHKIAGEFSERLSIICEDRQATKREILLALASAVWSFSQWQKKLIFPQRKKPPLQRGHKCSSINV